MSEPTKTPQGENVSVGDVAVTLVNQGVINTKIIIVEPSSHADGRRHVAHPAPHHPHQARPAPAIPRAIPSNPATPTLRPEVSFAPDGDRLTTYLAHDGASATYREDKQNGNAVTLTLQDGNGTLTTHGDRRGFEYTRVDALGHLQTESVTLDTYWKNPLQIGSVVDKVNCPNIGLQGVNVIPTITGDVTRDKLQQFAAHHPELQQTLNTVRLPVTISGGDQLTFAEAQARPSEFRACPPTGQGLIRK